MSANLAAQLDALNALSLAYQSARDFTLPVLRTAFGDPPPPPSECVWPPPGVAEWEAQSRLQWICDFLNQCKGLIRTAVREIKAAQVCLVAVGFDMPKSWIIVNPLDTFMGGMVGACGVIEIVKSVAAEDATIAKVLEEISVDLVLLKGKVAGLAPRTVTPKQSETNCGAGPMAETEPPAPQSAAKQGQNAGKDGTSAAPLFPPVGTKNEIMSCSPSPEPTTSRTRGAIVDRLDDGARERLNQLSAELLALPGQVHGEELARVALSVVAEAGKLGAFREDAVIQAALRRWEVGKNEKWDEVIGHYPVTDPAVITFQRIVGTLFPDLRDTEPIAEDERAERIRRRLPVTNTGKCSFHLWVQWGDAVRRISGLLSRLAVDANPAPIPRAKPEQSEKDDGGVAVSIPVRDKVFISYSHKDRRWLDDLLIHLKPYLRDGSVAAWSDQEIAPGSKWFAEIRTAIAMVKVAVLLVTPDFLASDFIHQHELGPLLKEAKVGGVRIIWVPVRSCSYRKTPLKDYQAVIDPKSPLASIKTKAGRDTEWVRVCEEIEKAVRC